MTARTASAPGPSSLSQSVAWFVGSYAVSILGYLVGNAAAARLLGPEEFGRFVVIFTVTVVVGQAALIGVHRAGLREAARIESPDDPALAVLRSDVRLVTLTLLPAAGLLSGAASWLLVSGDASERWTAAAGVAVLVVLNGHQKLWGNYLRGFGHTRLAGLLEGRSGGAAVAVLQALLLVLVVAVAPDIGLGGALCALALGYLLPIVAARVVVARRWHHVERERLGWWAHLRRIVHRDWRFFVLTTATSTSQYVELWLAGLVLSATDTSLFSGAQRLAVLLVFPLMSLQVVFSPAIARLWHAGETHRLERLLRTGATLATVVSVVVWLPMLVAPRTLMGLVYGGGFREGALCLLLLSAASMCNVLSGLCGAVLSMSGNEGASAALMTATTVGRLVVGVPAGLLFGLYGLAASALFFTAALNIGMWYWARRRVGVNSLPTARPRLGLLRTTRG